MSVERVASSDLFFPDLTLRPPRRTEEPSQLPAGETARRLKAERARFERGFLRWLRNAEDVSGVIEMREAVAAIEATQALPAARAFWWITIALLDALVERQVPVDFHVKKLCARIDLQMRRLLEGSKTVSERLVRDALYFVAVAKGGGALVQQVKAVSYTHLRAHETVLDLVCRLLLEKKKKQPCYSHLMCHYDS